MFNRRLNKCIIIAVTGGRNYDIQNNNNKERILDFLEAMEELLPAVHGFGIKLIGEIKRE